MCFSFYFFNVFFLSLLHLLGAEFYFALHDKGNVHVLKYMTYVVLKSKTRIENGKIEFNAEQLEFVKSKKKNQKYKLKR